MCSSDLTLQQNTPVVINEQILEKIDILSLRASNELTLELYPKELGKLTLKITESGGMIATTIKVDSERTKEMLLQNIDVLKESLEGKGLTVGSLEVEVRQDSQRFEMEKQRQKASKRIQEIIAKQLAELEETIEDVITLDSSSEIDIRA